MRHLRRSYIDLARCPRASTLGKLLVALDASGADFYSLPVLVGGPLQIDLPPASAGRIVLGGANAI